MEDTSFTLKYLHFDDILSLLTLHYSLFPQTRRYHLLFISVGKTYWREFEIRTCSKFKIWTDVCIL